MKRLRHKVGIDWAQPSTWRGAVLLASIGLSVLFGMLGHDSLASEIFVGGLTAVGAIGLGVRD